MNYVRAAVATTLVSAALICGSIAFGKPKISKTLAEQICLREATDAYKLCMFQEDDTHYCLIQLDARYSSCMDGYGYVATRPGKTPKLPKGPFHTIPGLTPTPSPGTSPVTTGTNAKKSTPTPTPTPLATPKKKGTSKNH